MREDLPDAVDAPAPERFEIVKQAMGGPQRRDIAAHALLTAVAGLGDGPRALQRSYVLVHRSEADRIATGQVGDRVRVAQHHGEDVAARGIGQRMKERVGPLALGHIYNHSVIVPARAETKTTSPEESNTTAAGRPRYPTPAPPL